jgi:hypothetical protein
MALGILHLINLLISCIPIAASVFPQQQGQKSSTTLFHKPQIYTSSKAPNCTIRQHGVECPSEWSSSGQDLSMKGKMGSHIYK